MIRELSTYYIYMHSFSSPPFYTALLVSSLSQLSFSPLLLIKASILSSLSQLSCSICCHCSPQLSFSLQLSSSPPYRTSPLLLASFHPLLSYYPQLSSFPACHSSAPFLGCLVAHMLHHLPASLPTFIVVVRVPQYRVLVLLARCHAP